MKYPIGIQDFRKLREEGYVYVDKTRQLYEALGNGNYFFLSRPRRFGKSLLLSTLNELYSGSRELFQGLWIEANWDWEAHKRPVIWLKFANIQYKYNPIHDAIKAGLNEEAQRLKVPYSTDDSTHPFATLIRNTYQEYGQRVVILVDEYDKPIIDYLDDIPQAEANRDGLKWLYSALKDCDPYIELLFITGVSAFSKVSIFSDLNHIANISLEPIAYTLLGITQQELEDVFAEPMLTHDKEKVKRWYNGYSWGGLEKVYNPFSLLRFLNSGLFNNYWFETGTPTFLVKEMKKHQYYDVSGIQTAVSDLNNFDFTRLNPISVLFQTGYLTIKKYEPEDLLYTLDYPNLEVRHSLEQLLLSEYLNNTSSSALPRVVKLRNALQNKDLDEVFLIINSALAEIPAELWKGQTKHFYHAIVHLSFSLLGTYIRSEVRSAKGRCDAVVETADHIYAFEFKLDRNATEAMQQIKNKGYLKPYADSSKEQIAVGANFSSESKQVVEWLMEEG